MTRARSKSTYVQMAAVIAPKALLVEIRMFVLAVQRLLATLVDSGLTLFYWQIGERIRRDILSQDRADHMCHAIRLVEDLKNEALSHAR